MLFYWLLLGRNVDVGVHQTQRKLYVAFTKKSVTYRNHYFPVYQEDIYVCMGVPDPLRGAIYYSWARSRFRIFYLVGVQVIRICSGSFIACMIYLYILYIPMIYFRLI